MFSIIKENADNFFKEYLFGNRKLSYKKYDIIVNKILMHVKK